MVTEQWDSGLPDGINGGLIRNIAIPGADSDMGDEIFLRKAWER